MARQCTAEEQMHEVNIIVNSGMGGNIVQRIAAGTHVMCYNHHGRPVLVAVDVLDRMRLYVLNCNIH